LGVAHVEAREVRPSARGPDRRDGRAAAGLVAVDDPHGRALAREAQGDRLADAGSGPGDEGGPAVEPEHGPGGLGRRVGRGAGSGGRGHRRRRQGGRGRRVTDRGDETAMFKRGRRRGRGRGPAVAGSPVSRGETPLPWEPTIRPGRVWAAAPAWAPSPSTT